MPNRVLREGILTSERVCSLSWEAEVFYRRLMSVVDDFGRYTAHPALLRASLYPLQLEKVREASMERFLLECEKARLVRLYAVRGKRYIEVLNFRQHKRATVSKFPAPEDPQQVLGIVAELPPQRLGEADEAPLHCTCGADAAQTRCTCSASAHERREARDEKREAEARSDLPPEAVLWNSHPELPQVIAFGATRWGHLRARRTEPFFVENLSAAIERVCASRFCLGHNNERWKANFDWLLRPDSVARIMEGKYDNREQPETADYSKGFFGDE